MLIKLLYAVAKPKSYEKRSLRLRRITLNAYVADTYMKSMFGLMFWKRLKFNEAMLLSFAWESRLGTAIAMQNMRFPIDILWLSAEGRIVDMHSNARPEKIYYPAQKAKYVLEVNTGVIKKSGAKRGDMIRTGF